jgi:zinc/manganese transport system substrate-binding protein/manganese/iron transport system substrate-binding protein
MSIAPRRCAVLLAGSLLIAGLLVACGSSNTSSTGRTTAPADVKPVAAGKMLTAVGTTTQIADFLKNVGGDRVKVVDLIAANQDPHEFEPKPADVQTLNGADIVFKNGVGLESNFAKFINNLPSSVPVIDLSRGVKLRRENGDKGDDPHIWHDPENAKIMVNNIRDALAARDPANAALYQQNALNYTEQLDQLDADIQKQVQAVPADKRKLVTNHDAFGYFVARYGIDFVGSVIPSLDTNSEPSAKDTEDLIKKIKAQHVCAIFTESSINPKLEQQIASDAGVKVYSNLYGDTLGPPGSDGDTYLKMEAGNARNMVAGMTQGC